MSKIIFFIFIIFFSTFSMARPAVSRQAMVVSFSPESTQAGLQTLKNGGNAADAAVTMAFAMAVTKPYYGSIGGGGFMLIKFKGQPVEVLDYREHAPLGATPDMFLKSQNPHASETGPLAVATPGAVAGLVALHKRYGKLKWEKLIEPAIGLAEKGFRVSNEWVTYATDEMERFSGGAMLHLTDKKMVLPRVGEILKQPGLAKALKLIQKNELKGFYEGEVAKDIVSSLSGQGILTLEDLKQYKVRWLKPLVTQFKGRTIYTMPPPSSGGIFLVELLALAEKLELAKQKPESAEEFHLIGESMARVSSDRFALGDPAFSQLPTNDLLSSKHIDAMALSISPVKKTKFSSNSTKTPHEGTNTTHYVVVDSEGQAVSATTTINDTFGSGIITHKFGITLNNEMDDFNTKPGKPNIFGLIQGEANKVEPLKTPLSSMTPTLIFDDKGELEMALGSPGGPKIISAVFQVVYHGLTTDWNLEQLLQAPRIHHQYLPDKLYYDSFGHSPDTLSILEAKGHTLSPSVIARVYAIRRMKNGLLEGSADPREEGLAAGF